MLFNLQLYIFTFIGIEGGTLYRNLLSIYIPNNTSPTVQPCMTVFERALASSRKCIYTIGTARHGWRAERTTPHGCGVRTVPDVYHSLKHFRKNCLANGFTVIQGCTVGEVRSGIKNYLRKALFSRALSFSVMRSIVP